MKKWMQYIMLLSLLVQFFTPMIALAKEESEAKSTDAVTETTSPSTDTGGVKDNLLSLDLEKSQVKLEGGNAIVVIKGSFAINDLQKELSLQLPSEFTLSNDQQNGEIKNEQAEKIGNFSVDPAQTPKIKLTIDQPKIGEVSDFYLELLGSYTRGPDADFKVKDQQDNEYTLKEQQENSQAKKPDTNETTTKQSSQSKAASSQSSAKQSSQKQMQNTNKSSAKSSQAKSSSSEKNKTTESTTWSSLAQLFGRLTGGNTNSKSAAPKVETKQSSTKKATSQSDKSTVVQSRASKLLIGPQAAGNLNDKLADGAIQTTIKYKTDAGEIKLGDPVPIDAQMNFQLDFDLAKMKPNQALEENDTYTLELPKKLKFTQAVKDRPLMNGDQVYGYYTIDPDTNKLTVTFTDPKTEGGSISFNASFDQDEVGKPGDKDIQFPPDTQIPNQGVTIKPKVQSSVAKQGTPDRQINPEKITWSVDINRDYEKIQKAQVIENFPKVATAADGSQKPQLLLEDHTEDVKVYTLDYDFSGNPIESTLKLVDDGDYTVDAQGNITFNKTITQPYRILYETTIGDDFKPKPTDLDGCDLKAVNEVIYDADGKELDAQATVVSHYKGMLGKVMDKYDKSTQTYDWTIQYNYSNKEIKSGQFVNDTYSANMDLVGDADPVIYPVTFDLEGNPIRDTDHPLDKKYYTVTKGTDNGKKTFKVTFTDEYDQLSVADQQRAYDVVYRTQVTTPVQDDTKITNKVNTESDPPKPVEVDHKPQQQMGIKGKPFVNQDSKMARWRIDINKNGYEMKDAVISDSSKAAAEKHLDFPRVADDPVSEIGFNLKDTTKNHKLVAGTDYKVTYYDASGNEITDPSKVDSYKTFKIQLIGSYADTKDSFQLEYFTKYDVEYAVENPNYAFKNDVDITWNDPKDPGAPKYSNTDTNQFKVNDNQANQGNKSGSYNPLTKTITWTMLVNYNNLKTPGVKVVDPIQGNQRFNGKFDIERGKIDSAGKFQSIGSVKTEPYISLENVSSGSSMQNVTFNIGELEEKGKDDYPNGVPGWNYDDITDQRNMVFKITYETTLDNTQVDKESQYNTANVTVAEHETTIDAKISIMYVNESSAKDGKYDEKTGSINWGIWLNRNQSTLIKPVITDEPSNNQLLDPNSLKVYTTSIDAKGKVTANLEDPVDPSQYEVKLTTDPTTNQQALTIDFSKRDEGNGTVGTIKKPYYITYNSCPNFSTRTETASNKATLRSNGKVVDNPPGTKKIPVTINDTTGTAYGPKGKLTIKKASATDSDELLAGAKFEIWQHYTKAGNTLPDRYMGEAVTNEKGEATFNNLVQTTTTGNNPFKYLVKEVTAPFGFVKMEKAINGYLVDLTGKESDVTITNAEQLYLKKTDRNGNKQLANAKFEVQVKDNTTWNKIGEVQTTSKSTVVNGKSYADPIDINKMTEKLAGPSSGKASVTYELQLKETKAPNGYYLNTNAIPFKVTLYQDGRKEIAVTEDGKEKVLAVDEIYQFELANYQGSATFNKTDKDGKGLTGAVFTLYDESGKKLRDNVTSVDAGEVLIKDLAPGKYSLQETKAPTGFYINNTKINFTIPEIAAGTMEDPGPVEIQIDGENNFKNFKGTAKLLKVDKDDNHLPEAVFNLVDKQGNLINANGEPTSEKINITSDPDGIMLVENLIPGKTYYLKEITAPFYNKDRDARYIKTTNLIEIKMPETAAVDGNGKQPEGTASVEKDGMVINDMTKSRPIYDFVWAGYFTKYRVTDLAHPDQMEPIGGAYYQLEYRDPTTKNWEVLDDKIQQKHGAEEVDVDGKTKYYFHASTDESENGQNLGRVQVGDLPVGDYRFTEVIPPKGYIKVTKPIEFSIPEAAKSPVELNLDLEDSKDPTSTLRKQAINYKGAVEITKQKVDNGGQAEVLGNAEFNIYEADANPEKDKPVNAETIKSDPSTGRVYYSDLAPGEYYLLEMKTENDNYITSQNKIPFEIKSSDNNYLSEDDIVKPRQDEEKNPLPLVNYKGQAVLTKKDGQGKTLKDAKFKVVKVTERMDEDAIRDAVAITGNEVLTSTEKGLVKTTELSPGEYAFVETEQPAGYIKNSQPQRFVIPKATTKTGVVTVEENTDDKELELANYQGRARLVKQDEKGQGLAGAKFKLEKVAVDQDGNVDDSKAETIRNGLTSNAKGEVNVTGIEPGFYRFVETSAPDNFILNEQPLMPFEIKADIAGDAEIVTKDITGKALLMYNYQGKAKLIKEDAQGKKLDGATFEMRSVKADKVVKGFEKLEVKDGELVVEQIPPGEYRFIELKAPKGYIQNVEFSKSFTIEAKENATNNKDGKPVEREVLGPITVKNYQGEVELTKQDSKTKKVLEAASFELRQGERVLQKDLKTNKSGKITVKQLAPGDYQFVETKAPTGYVLDQTPVEFTIAAQVSGKPALLKKVMENTEKPETPPSTTPSTSTTSSTTSTTPPPRGSTTSTTSTTPPPGGTTDTTFTPPGGSYERITIPSYSVPNIRGITTPSYTSNGLTGISVMPSRSYTTPTSSKRTSSSYPVTSLLKTGMKKSTTWIVLGVIIVAAVGGIWYQQRRKRS